MTNTVIKFKNFTLGPKFDVEILGGFCLLECRKKLM